MQAVAAMALAVIVAALIGALLSWRMLLAERPVGPAEARGIAFAPAGQALVVVDSLGHGGAALRAGLAVGDIVEAVNGQPVAGVAAADRAMAAPLVDIRVRRGDKRVLIHLSPARSPSRG